MQTADVTFSFKGWTEVDEKTKKPVMIEKTDDKGNVVMKDDKPVLVPKKVPAPAPIVMKLPQFLSLEDVAEVLQKNDPKEIELLLEQLNKAFIDRAKEEIDDNREGVRTNGIPEEKLTWNYIANIPPAQKRGPAIPEETWKEFAEDYEGLIVHHGKTIEQAKFASKLFLQKLQPVKMNKSVLGSLQTNLATWVNHTDKGEEFAPVYEYLTSKINEFLNIDADALTASV